MLVVGLTGGFASGKSTVASFFYQYGISVINADLIAKSLTTAHSPALEKIITYFGESFLDNNNELNRKKLRDYIFDHPKDKKWLEELLHPLIRAEITQQLNAVDSAYAIIEIPLLTESKHDFDYLNKKLVIDLPLAMQIDRAKQRNHLTEEEALKIIDQQASREQRLAIADDVITNDGDLEKLSQQVADLHVKYLKQAYFY